MFFIDRYAINNTGMHSNMSDKFEFQILKLILNVATISASCIS